ncbi:MAG TPA: hypothetical protein VE825_07970, partial [Terriglobales bacterium]|nr:hypothetical protein [Terriglobales bacterium]
MARQKRLCDSAVWGGKKTTIMVVISVLLITNSAFAAHGKVARDLDLTTAGSQTVDVIVQYNVPPTSKHLSKAQG